MLVVFVIVFCCFFFPPIRCQKCEVQRNGDLIIWLFLMNWSSSFYLGILANMYSTYVMFYRFRKEVNS